MNPLDQLADIMPPDTVSIWPLAWGYWLALALVVTIIGLSIYAIIQYRMKRQAKREALLALAKLNTSDEYYAYKVQVIMKSLCAHYLPLSFSSQMHGQQWKSLILSVYHGKDTNSLSQALDTLYQGLYVPESKTEQDITNRNEHTQKTISKWISSSFPCNKNSESHSSRSPVAAKYSSEVNNV